MERSAIEEILELGATDPACHSTVGFGLFFLDLTMGSTARSQAQAPHEGGQRGKGQACVCCAVLALIHL